MNYKVNRT